MSPLKSVLILVTLCVAAIFLLLFVAVALVNYKESLIADNAKFNFNEGKVIICNNTLRVVNNGDWSIIENNLINKNIAGYIDIRYCRSEK